MVMGAAGATDIEVAESVIVGLLLVAALVAIAVSRVRVPYTVALVVVGLVLGVSGAFSSVDLTSDLILLVFLPPLLFEGAFNMELAVLKRRWKQVAVLAFAGTLIAAAAIAAPLVFVPGMALELAVVLAVILAPTDPVSVLAVFKEAGVGVGLRTLMEGESIFNDALAIVLYVIAVDVAFGDNPVTVQHAVSEFGVEVMVGTAVGVGVGFVAHRLMATLDDHLVEITLSLVTAYGAYLAADRLGGSGVIAVVVGGLLLANYGPRRAMSAASHVAMTEFWEVLAFLANSALFLIIGLEFHVSDLRGRTLAATAVAVAAMLAGRAIIAFGLLAPFRRSRRAAVPGSWQVAAFWGGLRGSIPIALVLGLGERRFAGVDAVAVVFGVVFFSLVVQGLTYRPLLRRLGLTGPPGGDIRYERLLARTIALQAARSELEAIRDSGEVAPALLEEMLRDVTVELHQREGDLAQLAHEGSGMRGGGARRVARRVAAAQRIALSDAARAGQISATVAREASADSHRVETEDTEQSDQPTVEPEAPDPDHGDNDRD